MQAALHGKIKEWREKDGRGMINLREHSKHTLPFNCSYTTQDITKVHNTPFDEN